MADSAPVTEAAPVASPPAKKAKSSGASKKPRVKPNHPPTSDMVNSAIKSLKERGGSSLQAIKKYISANYKIDAEKLSPFIKKYLKTAVTGGKLIQTKGKGASGSFKLSAAGKGKSESAPKKSAAARPKKAKAAGEKKPKAKKAASPAKKKSAPKAADKKKAAAPAKAAKKAKAVKAPKEKSTKPKAAAKKPKTPKPKKAAPAKKAAPKKAAPKKK